MSEKKQEVSTKMQILGQFIKDLSFENIAAQESKQGTGTPNIEVKINLDASKRTQDDQYNSSIKISVESKDTKTNKNIFLLELDYGGIFKIENIPDDQLHPFLMIECPRMLFPFVRRVVHDVTRDGGYPPLNLDSIDFLAMYRAEVDRLSAEPKLN
ncbi:protein-export chaperone SecB [Paracoccaceae bacterium]|jgi:preprotein translocase subunit SecB|nr:protein-export chaperone SecB [Paracoccaceae bacterium]|tara:strand:- start:646 stop:1113 length:468 start_codon:yes stop_codon:yes gene_type:complete